MDKPISVGDLVMVVRKGPRCCGKGKSIGIIFRVQDIRMSRGFHCIHCKKKRPEEVVAVSPERHGKGAVVYEMRRLKRIPPPEELGIVDEREVLHSN